MVVTTENTGDIICRYDTGERFLVTDVSTAGFFFLTEDGTQDYLSFHTVNGEVVHDEEQVNFFHQNLKLAQSLFAAEQAAQRRLSSGQTNSLASEEASRVSQIVRAQRQAFLDRLGTERDARKAGHAPSFEVILKSAKDRSASRQQNQEPGIQHNNFNR